MLIQWFTYRQHKEYLIFFRFSSPFKKFFLNYYSKSFPQSNVCVCIYTYTYEFMFEHVSLCACKANTPKAFDFLLKQERSRQAIFCLSCGTLKICNELIYQRTAMHTYIISAHTRKCLIIILSYKCECEIS